MKFIHLSDLHIGKRVNEFSMIEDQTYLLNQILSMIEEQQPDGIFIAGDVYDKSLPTVEGVSLLDEFLSKLHRLLIPVFLISGNHDSAERIEFGSRILRNSNIYIAGAFQGELRKVTLQDEYGPLHVYLLPFVKPAVVAAYFEGVETYEEAVQAVLSSVKIDTKERNVLIAHQFVTAGGKEPDRCDSENISVGGLDNIDASCFDAFDYVALGHLHGPQAIGRETIRYAGSPLKYSFSEANHKKSITMVTMCEKEKVEIAKLSLTPLRDLRELMGPIATLLSKEYYTQGNVNDYIHATLTDEEELYDAIGRIRSVYPNVMRIDFKNSKTRLSENAKTAAEDVVRKDPLTLFCEFFENQNNNPMLAEQLAVMQGLLEVET